MESEVKSWKRITRVYAHSNRKIREAVIRLKTQFRQEAIAKGVEVDPRVNKLLNDLSDVINHNFDYEDDNVEQDQQVEVYELWYLNN